MAAEAVYDVALLRRRWRQMCTGLRSGKKDAGKSERFARATGRRERERNREKSNYNCSTVCSSELKRRVVFGYCKTSHTLRRRCIGSTDCWSLCSFCSAYCSSAVTDPGFELLLASIYHRRERKKGRGGLEDYETQGEADTKC